MSLKPCPDSPNCVSTMAEPEDAGHFMAPLTITASSQAAISAVAQAVTASGGAISTQSADRLEAIFTSKLFRFKDDVSFLVDTEAGLLHFRSASRVGHSDLGANRKRMLSLLPLITDALALQEDNERDQDGDDK